MRKSGLGVARQRGIVVFRDAVIVGEYTAAPMVEDQVIVELRWPERWPTCMARGAETTCGLPASLFAI